MDFFVLLNKDAPEHLLKIPTFIGNIKGKVITDYNSSHPYSEFPKSYIGKAWTCRNLFRFSPKSSMKAGIRRIGSGDEDVLFITGMLTDESVGLQQADFLAKVLDRKVELIHNLTGGFIVDAVEYAQDKLSPVKTQAVHNTVYVIKEKLKQLEGELIVTSFSQGTVISTKAMEILEAELSDEDLSRIKHFTFGGAFSECKSDKVLTEHYCNNNDIVCKMFPLESPEAINGRLLVNQHTGHSFNVDYISEIMHGSFGVDSEFYRLIKRRYEPETYLWWRADSPIWSANF